MRASPDAPLTCLSSSRPLSSPAAQVASGVWQPAACSRDLVLKQCLQLPVPLWREVMCLLGGEFAEEARRLQRDDDGSSDDE